MFADMELIGIPHRVVIGERGLDNGEVSIADAKDNENQMLPLAASSISSGTGSRRKPRVPRLADREKVQPAATG